jgi:hypothetical protein
MYWQFQHSRTLFVAFTFLYYPIRILPCIQVESEKKKRQEERKNTNIIKNEKRETRGGEGKTGAKGIPYRRGGIKQGRECTRNHKHIRADCLPTAPY